MEFLKLIASGIQSLMTLPMDLLRTIGQWRFFRTTVGRSVTDVRGELKPLSAVGRFFRRLALVLFGLLVLALVAGVFYGLWYLNRWLDLERQLAGPWPLLRQVWLPLLFVLFVALLVVARWLWRLLGREREPTDFADIHEAWVEARTALEAAGVSLAEVPLFLVLGRPAAGVDALFGASRLPFPVRQAPKRGDAPVQVYANGQAVYVVCPGASLLSSLAALLAGEGEAKEEVMPPAGTVFEELREELPTTEAPASAAAEPGEPLLLADAGSQTATALAEEPEAAPRRRPSLLKLSDEVARQQARLNYLCRLLAFNRRPYCAANGLLLLLPFDAAQDEEGTSEAAGVSRLDLAAARAGLKTDCPVFALVCDLETAPGFAAFARSFPEERRRKVLGQAFPLVPDLPAADVPAMVEGGARWVGEALARLVYRLFQAEASLNDNAALYQLLASVRERLDHVGQVLARAALLGDGQRPLLGGCFLAATGADPSKDQAFVAGVFRLLLENQNAVAWTPEALAEEADYQRWTMYGYLGVGAFVLGMGLLIWWQLRV